jgi:hypothetical protein
MADQMIIPDAEIRRQREAIEFDALVAEMLEILAENPNPWRVDNNCGDNWLIASFGEDQDGKHWYLTTDYVRASEYCCDAESDAKFCALAKTLMPLLIERLEKR